MDVIDDLYSYDVENPLSANKGRELREMIEEVQATSGCQCTMKIWN